MANCPMSSERELLIKFCSQVTPTAQLVAGILENGIENFLCKTNRFKKVDLTEKPVNLLTSGLKVITYLDQTWPKQLFDLDDEMPLVLWLNSDFPDLTTFKSAITITGSMQPSISDSKILGRLMAAVTSATVPIITDGAAGTGELLIRLGLAQKAELLVVRAAGLQARSKSQLNLPQQVVQISESPPTAWLSKSRLLRRNRIVAALSFITVAISPRPFTNAASIWHWADLLGRDRIAI